MKSQDKIDLKFEPIHEYMTDWFIKNAIRYNKDLLVQYIYYKMPSVRIHRTSGEEGKVKAETLDRWCESFSHQYEHEFRKKDAKQLRRNLYE